MIFVKMMSLKGIFSCFVILLTFEYGYCCKKVYFVPGFGEPTWYAQKYVDKLHRLYPCSEFEVIPHNLLQPTSWKMVRDLKPKFDEITKANPNGMHLMGVSQGGSLARALVEITPNHTVQSLITLSTPHNGCFGLPQVGYFFPPFNAITSSDFFNQLVNLPLFQEVFPIGVLWKDPIRYSEYLKYNKYLTTLNNEIPHPDADSYKKAMLKLKHFVMITGKMDSVVIPYQSNIFGYYDKNLKIVNMTEQEIYKNDTLGLKTLNEDGRIHICVRKNLMHITVHEDVPTIKSCVFPYLD